MFYETPSEFHNTKLSPNYVAPKAPFESDCCQKCGAHIGWLGRFMEWIWMGLIDHNCKPKK